MRRAFAELLSMRRLPREGSEGEEVEAREDFDTYEAQAQAPEPTPIIDGHTHHWVIEPPSGPTSIGRCRCGLSKEFENVGLSKSERYGWNGSPREATNFGAGLGPGFLEDK